jgi:outer membrane protein assembly factor BamE (lipoprotein component of BamABCDE complex)
MTLGETTRWVSSIAALIAVIASIAGCASTTTRHGHLFADGDLQQVQPGMSVDAVRLALGTPDTTSAVPGGQAFYYISSTEKQTGFQKPDEVDRKVVAVYFNGTGNVDQVSQYGMQDGRLVDYVSRETPAFMRDKNFIARFFRGVGPKTKIVDD